MAATAGKYSRLFRGRLLECDLSWATSRQAEFHLLSLPRCEVGTAETWALREICRKPQVIDSLKPPKTPAESEPSKGFCRSDCGGEIRLMDGALAT